MLLCKVLFTIIGYLIGSYLELGGDRFVLAFCGFILGVGMDAGLSVLWRRYKIKKYTSAQVRAKTTKGVLDSVFPMLAKLASVDGVIQRSEISAVETVMSEIFRFNKVGKKLAKQIFKESRNSNKSFHAHAAQYYDLFYDRPEMLQILLQTLMMVATSDGAMSPEEEKLIASAAEIFNISRDKYLTLLSPFCVLDKFEKVSTVQDPYKTLGCKMSDSNEFIKHRYWQLILEFHPDKMKVEVLPQGVVSLARERFLAIQSAYEQLKQERKIA